MIRFIIECYPDVRIHSVNGGVCSEAHFLIRLAQASESMPQPAFTTHVSKSGKITLNWFFEKPTGR